MLKNILKLEGVQKLSKTQQKAVNGAGACTDRITGECLIFTKYCKMCYGQD
jgi:hypothetical protein